jgi:hypothetical protein
MPRSKDNQSIFERRCKESGTVFVDSLRPNKWPTAHLGVFRAVARTDEYMYSDCDTAHSDRAQMPWKRQPKVHARKLVGKAQQCVMRNESPWRFACEPLVFSRLSSEVAW